MSDKKDKKRRSNTETARRIWLAGIGAYGRAFTEAQEAIKDISGDTSRVFDDLVEKGEFIELAVNEKRKEIMDKTGMADLHMPDLHIPDFNMDERIAKMRSRLMRGEEVADDISDMGARLDAIEAKLDKVLDMLEPKKSVPKKTTTTRRKKAE